MTDARIEVNRAACEGHGLCEQAAPHIYELDEEGFVRLRVRDLAESQLASAEDGARACPVVALTIRR